MKFLELIEDYKEDIIKSTQESIRIKSVEEEALEGKPFGQGPYEALNHLVDLGEEMGFRVKNLDNYVAYGEIGQGEETLGILGHVDVVPEGDGWIYPAYGGEIHDGKIWGRGAIDDKGPTIACMYAMKALKESGVKFNKKVRIIFGANEETGWKCMDHYFKHEEAPDIGFTPDADFPVIYGEKGILNIRLDKDLGQDQDFELISLKSGNAPNMVADKGEVTLRIINKDRFTSLTEKENIGLSWEGDLLTIRSQGISAHGSTPEKGLSALSILMEYLGEVLPKGGLKEFVDFYNTRVGFSDHGEKMACDFEDDISGKLNFNPGLVSFNGKTISLIINIRYPIKVESEKVYQAIEEAIEGLDIRLIRDKGESKPLYVSEDSFLVKTLMEVYKEETGDENSRPLTIGGGTYARAMKNAVAFGPMFPGQEDVVHQKNEYISIDHLMKLTRIYAKAIYALTR